MNPPGITCHPGDRAFNPRTLVSGAAFGDLADDNVENAPELISSTSLETTGAVDEGGEVPRHRDRTHR